MDKEWKNGGPDRERKKGETAREYAYRLLREGIVSLRLAPGSSFNDMEFSKEIGVSRTPVREAVIQLKEESRIIEIFPQRGMRIARIDAELVEESRSLRILLEKSAAAQACLMAEPEDMEWLEENVKLQDFYLENGLPDRLLQLDNELHKKLFLICRRELTYHMCQKMAVHYDRIRSLSVSHIKDRTIIEDHRRLVQAIRDRSPQEAEAVMEQHLSRWRMDEQSFRESYPDYFN